MIDTKTCTTDPLRTPCRGAMDTRSQAPTTSSKKQVSWSDILTPHRGHGMDNVTTKVTRLDYTIRGFSIKQWTNTVKTIVFCSC
jgi:hypothetical protein